MAPGGGLFFTRWRIYGREDCPVSRLKHQRQQSPTATFFIK
jgi:hypothetical protein